MDISVYQAAAAMNASSRWQEVIADNLSASQIPGFKKQDMTFRSVQAGFMADKAGSSSAASQRYVMPLANSVTNFMPGELQPTGNPTDLAIEGSGFFTIQMPDGSTGYSRDGEFRLNPKGDLISKQGLPVMGENGPIQTELNGVPVTVNSEGEVRQAGTVKGKLAISEFTDPTALVMNGYGFYVTGPNAVARGITDTTVRQGFVEHANTSTMVEMSSLITAMRFYEANQRVIQTEDERVSKLITEIGNPV